MNCKDIDEALNGISPDKNGKLRGRGRVIDKLHSLHLQSINRVSMSGMWAVALVYAGKGERKLRQTFVSAWNSDAALGAAVKEFFHEMEGMELTMYSIKQIVRP